MESFLETAGQRIFVQRELRADLHRDSCHPVHGACGVSQES
jgi:hypothetical protein